MPTILQLAKLATPALAATALLAHVKAAPVAGWVLMPKVTVAFDVVTVLPLVSSMVTTGWVPKAAPSAPPPGWVVKTSLAGVPPVMLNEPLVPVTGPLAVALKL